MPTQHIKDTVTHVAAALGVTLSFSTVNLFLALPPVIWVVIQIYNYFKYTKPLNELKLKQMKGNCDEL